MNDTETSIYVIGSARGPKKVGLARNPASRMQTIQTGHSRRVGLLYSCVVPKGRASDIERRAHWLLRDKKAHGEWFTVGAEEAKEAVKQAVNEGGEGEKATSAVGRPPLSKKFETKTVLIRMPLDVQDRIDAIAGPNKRGEFIREAVERELKRREKLT